MIGLPKTTEFNKRIPKQKFYENLTMTAALKNEIKDAVKTIYWRNKIAVSTMNLAEGKTVIEIEVFEIRLNRPQLDKSVLRQIDKEIPYHILFLLEYNGKYQACLGYKESTVLGGNRYKISDYYYTEWLSEEKLNLKAEGLNMDMVYENFIRQIAGDKLKMIQGETLGDMVANTARKAQLESKIEKLIVKKRKEKQLNRQIEINTEIKKLKKELEELING